MPFKKPTDTEIKTAWAITSVFETGKASGDYSMVAVLKDGAGISYGKHQATDRSGTLDKIVHQYVHRGGSLAGMLAPYIVRLTDSPPTLHKDDEFMQLLANLGKDPVMQKVQDDVFARDYWRPALKTGEVCELELPLSYAVLYDICIQSGPGRIKKLRKQFKEVPPSKGGDEESWVRALNNARWSWLRGHSNPVVRTTVYRPKSFFEIMTSEAGWNLQLPLRVWNVTISETDL